MWRHLRTPIWLTVLALVLTLVFGGVAALVTVTILCILEITLSFDNAIVNAKILKRMSPKWQRLFLTVGILIAVFGMRLVFPLLIVSVAAHIDPISAFLLATTSPDQYAHYVTGAHHTIAAFGGTFLLMLFLDWLFEDRTTKWITWLEGPFARLGSLPNASVLVMAAVLLTSALTSSHTAEILIAGLVGLAVYLLVNGVDQFFESRMANGVAAAGLPAFLYLEVLDASFSFDGVVGAFAVTNNIILIAIGLGVGALFIRGMTVHLTNSGTLAEFRYLEHGAHWAIGTLAVLLLLTIELHIPELATGVISIAFIAGAFYASVRANQRGVAKVDA